MVKVYLIIVLAILSCKNSDQFLQCDQAREKFIKYFDQKKFDRIPALFKPGIKSSHEYRRLTANLAYMRNAIGPVKSSSVLDKSNNRIVTKVDHQESSLEISFKFNERCELLALKVNTHYPENLPQLERNQTALRLPFNGDWYVQWGGRGISENYHNAHRNMKGAVDFLKRDQKGSSYRTDGRKNEDYYAFGEKIIAPCAGKIIRVINDVPDNQWPEVNQDGLYGNIVVLETATREYILLGHLQEGSITVEEGQLVKQGDLLGRCGNSGYSKEPHLHFNIQNTNNLFHSTGADCFFKDIRVDGMLKDEHLPSRGETVVNRTAK